MNEEVEEKLSKRQRERAQRLMQQATKIEEYILERLEHWYSFRESYLFSKESRILNMHEDLDGTGTDWSKILLVCDERPMGNFPVLIIQPPMPGSNNKHVVTVELMDKDKPLDAEGLNWLALFRRKMASCGMKLHCRHKLLYDEQEGYKFEVELNGKARFSYDNMVEFLEKFNE